MSELTKEQVQVLNSLSKDQCLGFLEHWGVGDLFQEQSLKVFQSAYKLGYLTAFGAHLDEVGKASDKVRDALDGCVGKVSAEFKEEMEKARK